MPIVSRRIRLDCHSVIKNIYIDTNFSGNKLVYYFVTLLY